MANRHLSRTLALQVLFEWDFSKGSHQVEETLEYLRREFAPDFDDQGFSLQLVKNIIDHHREIDALISKFAPEWPLEQITTSDRNVLRIGVYELKLAAEIPPKVAINEAIELAKAYGGDSSGKFVNGVLGSIYREMVQKGEKQSLSSQGIKEVSVGGVIYRQADDGLYFVLILDAYGKWTFPKGGIKEGEDEQAAVKRELEEETGLKNLRILGYLGESEVKVHKPDKRPYRKIIKYFLIETPDSKLVVPQVSELKDVKWFSRQEALEIIGYENAKDIFVQALNEIKQG
ncbi:MAG: transcription antitermination factor NusB [Patescibacteria group bacterium]|nr:transcription antitermination factor NusB [Patescibacteria group bacterium]